MNLQILYEDNHLIAVFKPAGMPSQPDMTRDVSMLDAVKQYLKETYQKPGNVFVGLLHRLDRPVSGVMLFAKTSKGASRLSEQFRNGKVQKTYYAIVVGHPAGKKGILSHQLAKKNHRAVVSELGKSAGLAYEVLAEDSRCSLLKIHIEGGRFHQIRAQLAAAGFSILGDVKYGGSAWSDKKSIALSATGISFRMATSNELVNISIPVPAEWEQYLSTAGT